MNWHIVGSSGYIAGRLLSRLPQDVPIYCYAPDRQQETIFLDLTQRDKEVFSRIQQGDFVVFLAAISSPDICSKEYELAYSINVTGTNWFLEECVKRKANILFFSSDAVNGATDTPQNEDSEPRPVGPYGKMKREIELAFQDSLYVKVFRLSYVLSAQDKFIGYLCSCRESQATADVFDALYRNVVYLEDVLDAVYALSITFQQWKNYIFNLSGPQLLSREGLAKIYQRCVAPDLVYTVSTPPVAFFDARPNVIATESLYLRNLLCREPASAEDAIQKEF